MSNPGQPQIGRILWQDLTVPNASEVRDFYSAVVGWAHTDHDMGDYSDYNMNQAESGETLAGICHSQGPNANIPPQWLVYIYVADVDESARKCVDLGGKLLDGPRTMGDDKFCVIQDPAGAVAALIGR